MLIVAFCAWVKALWWSIQRPIGLMFGSTNVAVVLAREGFPKALPMSFAGKLKPLATRPFGKRKTLGDMTLRITMKPKTTATIFLSIDLSL